MVAVSETSSSTKSTGVAPSEIPAVSHMVATAIVVITGGVAILVLVAVGAIVYTVRKFTCRKPDQYVLD